MSDPVSQAYDARAREYAELFLDHLERVPGDRASLDAFARCLGPGAGVVADLGCGVGNVVDYLRTRDVEAVGFDTAPAMIAEARHAFPEWPFEEGDLTSLAFADGSLSGIVSRYSLIHLSPTRLRDVFREWSRVLRPGAPVLVSFFAATSAETHGRTFDHAVVTAYELDPGEIAATLEAVGFASLEVSIRGPLDGERPLDHASILARRA